MTYALHPAAERDLADAFDFYLENAGPAVAGRFLGEFERVAKLLVDNPGFGTPLAGGRRMFLLRVFPYAVIYRQFEQDLRILVIRHQHRHPDYGRRRR